MKINNNPGPDYNGLTPAKPEHVQMLSGHIEDFERMDIMRGFGTTVEDMLLYGIACADEAFTIMVKGQPAAIYGVQFFLDMTMDGNMWGIKTTRLAAHKPRVALEGLTLMNHWANKYGHITAVVASEYEEFLRWLEWCGFIMHDVMIERDGESHNTGYKECHAWAGLLRSRRRSQA